jgi:hypothetical protein
MISTLTFKTDFFFGRGLHAPSFRAERKKGGAEGGSDGDIWQYMCASESVGVSVCVCYEGQQETTTRRLISGEVFFSFLSEKLLNKKINIKKK